MSTVREIMMARAKQPAKIHSMDRGAAPNSIAPSPSHARPSVVQFGDADQAGDGECIAGAQACKPPRLPHTPGGPGATGALPPRGRASVRSPSVGTPTKTSEGRRPRPNSEPGSRAPSEPHAGRGPGGGAEAGGAAKRSVKRSASVPRARIGDAPPPIDKKNAGRVPSYLKKRQDEWAEEERVAALPQEPKAPPGYRRVPEAERQGTLDTLKRRKAEVEKEQNKLPFNIETAGQKQREKELAGRHAHLEKLFAMFSKPVVFVPQDSEPIVNTLDTPTSAAGPSRGSGGILPADDASEDGRERAHGAPRSSSGGAAGRIPSVQSRERRAAASSERRSACAGQSAPWDRPNAEESIAGSNVRIINPPGGRSSNIFGD